MIEAVPIHTRPTGRVAAALGLAALAVAGMLAALTFAAPAFAWDIYHLPPGWTFDTNYNVLPGNCQTSVTIRPPGQIGPTFCVASPTWQTDVDAWVSANYTPPVTTTGTTAATTTATTTTAVTTTDPVTVTQTTTDPGPAPAPTTPTDTTTVATTTPTATVAATDPTIVSLQAQIDALHAELKQLVCLLQTSKTLDPGILAALMSMDSCS